MLKCWSVYTQITRCFIYTVENLFSPHESVVFTTFLRTFYIYSLFLEIVLILGLFTGCLPNKPEKLKTFTPAAEMFLFIWLKTPNADPCWKLKNCIGENYPMVVFKRNWERKNIHCYQFFWNCCYNFRNL